MPGYSTWISTRKAWTEGRTVTHLRELVKQFGDRPSNNIHGVMREIDEGFDSLLQRFVCLDLAEINARMNGELEQGMNIKG